MRIGLWLVCFVFSFFFCGAAMPAPTTTTLSFGLSLSDRIDTIWKGEQLATHGCYGLTITDKDDTLLPFLHSCAQEGKTAVVTLRSQNDETFPSLEKLHALAKQFDQAKGDIYVNLYPYTPSLAKNRLVYQANWAQAAAIFRQEAPSIQLIWSLPAEDVQYAFSFAPKVTDYDLLGLSCHGTPKEVSLQLPFALQFLSLQSQNPLSVSSLGISHYETSTHRYTIEEAATALQTAYDACRAVPTLRLLLYDNSDQTIALPAGVAASNYAISSDETLRRSYQQALQTH